MKIKDLVSLRSFQPVINLKWADDKNEQLSLLENYILTEDLAELFTDVLETITMKRSPERCDQLGGDIDSVDVQRSHIISGQYGTGKSYFLLMLSIILELKNDRLAEELLDKVKEFTDLHYQLDHIIDEMKYLVVRINGENENEKHFDDVIQEAVINRLHQEFDNVVLKSNYQNLLDNLIAHKEHDVRSKLLEEVLNPKSYNYQDLLEGLKGHQREAKDRYIDLMKEAGLSSGDDFKNLEEFIEDVNEFLISQGYDELIIILDEFSAYLDASVEARRSKIDLGNIQTLAQLTAPTSKYNISFITSTHVDIKEILNQAFTNQEDINKVFGRFKQRQIAFNQGNELIKDTIKIDKSKFNQIKQKHLALITQLENQYGVSVEDYYPLHPASLIYLQPVAQKFAQKDRTLFVFLKEVVKERYFNEDVEVNGELNFIQLDDIFDKFLPAFEQDRNLIKVYNQMREIADSELATKINKALVISYVSLLSTGASAKRTAGLSKEDLQNIYFVEENQVTKALDHLVEDNRSHIVFNDDKYQLVISNTGINLEQEISKEAQNVNPYRELRRLLKEEENSLDIKRQYNLKYNRGLYPLSRELEGKLTTAEDFTDVKDLEDYFRTNKDGKLTFIVPKFNEKYNLADFKNKYAPKFQELPANVALALPKKIYFKEKDLKEYGAIKILETNDEIIKNDDLTKLLGQRKRKLEGKIRNRFLRKFGKVNNFTFIFGQGIVRDDIRQDKELFKELLYQYYDKFPLEIEVENFDSRSASNSVIKRMIATGEDLISKSSSSVFQKQIFNTMKPLDLITIEEQPDNYKVKMKIPREEVSQKSYQIWQIITDDNMSIEEKFETLESAPYGLNEALIELYIAVALGLGKFRLKDRKGKVVTAPNKDHIVNIKNSNYEMEEVPDTHVGKKEKVKEVWQILSKIIPNSQYRSFDPHGRKEDNKFFAILGREIKAAINNLDRDKDVMEGRGLNTKPLANLKDELIKVTKSMSPEKLYEKLIELVDNLYPEKEYNATLKEIEDLIDNLDVFNNKKKRINHLSKQLDNLKGKIHILSDYSNLKEKLNNVKEMWSNYQKEPFNFTLISEIEDELKMTIAGYNQKYKEAHDAYYQKFEDGKEKILNGQQDYIELIKKFEAINFEITKVSAYINELHQFKPCDQLTINNDEVAKCSCNLKSLQSVENRAADIEKKINLKRKQIANIYTNYIDDFNANQGKINRYLEENLPDKLDDWNFIIGAINDDAIAHKDKLKVKLEDLAPEINEALSETEDEEEVQKTNRVKLNEFMQQLESKVKAYGRNNISFADIKDIFNEVCNELNDIKDYEGLKLGE
ncbi:MULTISPECIES: hypothetical protein [unclassified Candidatus Frackibacter]|uniref:hypothetical protein n=1 Tax=unclassified Candidatus Frackibacter TaxID=2648818 RepID=UPI0008803443|nr:MULTISPECIES: hypothetical protein [unclassified Candidatus Frackibacter]SDC27700.1 hypothetical protein SAMN04515661_10582 [Candidatus Frackibacter sp. WG11]SEM54598.1 hypothetical protein SAMN04488698_10683 [Candidatus Frackibacter sp. WG12]SFL53771.1 hypothetical protein SAMN04488699_10511 [Candidatus Frackibacter sp. WG13]